MTRQAAIRWAAKELLIVEEFHISTLADEQLESLIRISASYMQDKQRYNLEVLEAKTRERKLRDAKRVSEHNARAAKRRKKR